MASTCCSCRTTALRTFVRSVAQAHHPNDQLPRVAPWRGTCRPLHQRGTVTARWPAVNRLSDRSIHTSTADSTSSPAVELEEGQEAESIPTGKTTPTAAAESPSDAAVAPGGTTTAPHNLLAEEVKLFEAVRLSKSAKNPKRARATVEKKPKARRASSINPHGQEGDSQPHKGAAEDVDVDTERISVEEIEAESRARELNRLRLKAERAKAREREKEELERQKQEEEKQRQKERLKSRPDWAAQKAALKAKFPEGWRPRKKLSPDAINGMRALNRQFPETYTTQVLSKKFELSPEAIRRILRSKWEANPDEEEDRERRWHNRGVSIWQHYAAIGKKPPAKWRAAGVGVSTKGAWNQEEESEYDFSVEGHDWKQQDDAVDVEQMKRIKRQQDLSKNLL